ncbi:MAG: hypothetical protein COA32_17445 [Fluviicola sp.]|nr:MAG: hypothetical protein COA32_17445 [Fluviicola sp.]
MDKKEILQSKLRKSLYRDKIEKKYINLFQKEDIKLIHLNDFYPVEFNSLISFIEPSKFNSFHVYPQRICDLDDSEIEITINKLSELIKEKLEGKELFVFHGSNGEIGSSSFYIALNKRVFLKFIYDFIGELESWFTSLIVSEDKSRFLYFFPNKSGNKLLVYTGSIIDNKYVKLDDKL